MQFEDLIEGNRPEQMAKTLGQRAIRNPTYLEKLLMQKSELEDQLKKVNDVIEAFKKNPEIAQVVEIMSKLHI